MLIKVKYVCLRKSRSLYAFTIVSVVGCRDWFSSSYVLNWEKAEKALIKAWNKESIVGLENQSVHPSTQLHKFKDISQFHKYWGIANRLGNNIMTWYSERPPKFKKRGE
jgi:hypothetical protein